MTSRLNKDSAGEQHKSAVKKPYQTPAFRFERVFEVSALSCGKRNSTQASCVHNRKVS